MLALVAFAVPPLWWSVGDPPVIVPGAPQNNKGPANIGQAKHMAKSALDVLRPILPAVTAQIEADLAPILNLTVPNPKPADWAEKQKAPLLIGQLKAIADPFYTRLHAAAPAWLEAERIANGTNHPNSIFPWSTETTDDNNKGIANIGQLKAVFSLRFENLQADTTDTDGDGIPNDWEFAHGINPNDPTDASNLFPGSELTFLEAYQQGVQANPAATPGDRDGDGLANLVDADPDEMLVDWARAGERGYVVINLGLPPLELGYNDVRPLLGIVLNNSDALAKEPNPDENAPYYWGAETDFQWHQRKPYVRPGHSEPYVGWDSSAMFSDNGKIQIQGWLTGTGGPGGYWDMIVWTDHEADPLVSNGPGDDYKELRYTTLTRFDRTVTENQTISFPTYPDTAIPLTRTTTICGNTAIQTADYAASSTLWEVFRSHQRSSAAPILRSGNILERQPSTMQYRIGNIPLSFEPFSTLEDPHSNLMVSTFDSTVPNWEPLKVYRHRNSAWEKTPLPLMNDMNESGVGITYPGNSIWKNGRQIQLDGVLHGSGWDNIMVEQINRNGTLLGSAKKTGGNGAGDIVPVLLKELHVMDNTDATGVDDVSMTAETNDPGYQQDIWIMAPIQGSETFTNENRARFKVGGENTPSMGTGTLTVANATPVPNKLTVNGTFQDIDWRGTGTGIDSEQPIHFQLGNSINGNLPVSVKAMKYRDVKVIVHSVTGAKKDTATGAFKNLKPPETEITDQQIKDKLYQVFSRQINAWFSDLEIVEHTIDWDIGKTSDWGTPEFPITESSFDPYNRILDLGANDQDEGEDPKPRPEEKRLLELIDPASEADIHVFLLGGCWGIQIHEANGINFEHGDSIADGWTDRSRNIVYVASEDRDGDAIPTDIYLTIIAHEIGHIFAGSGHPDQHGGVAPLSGTNHLERLMFSNMKQKAAAGALHKNLLVKAEWDHAEDWMKTRPTGDD